MKRQSPLFKHYQGQDSDSLARSQGPSERALLLDPQPVIGHKTGCHHYKALLCFVSFSRFLVLKVTRTHGPVFLRERSIGLPRVVLHCELARGLQHLKEPGAFSHLKRLLLKRASGFLIWGVNRRAESWEHVVKNVKSLGRLVKCLSAFF